MLLFLPMTTEVDRLIGKLWGEDSEVIELLRPLSKSYENKVATLPALNPDEFHTGNAIVPRSAFSEDISDTEVLDALFSGKPRTEIHFNATSRGVSLNGPDGNAWFNTVKTAPGLSFGVRNSGKSVFEAYPPSSVFTYGCRSSCPRY